MTRRALARLAVLLLWLPLVLPASGPGFRSRQKLDEHYHKHQAEFGHITKAEYVRLAQALRAAPAGGPILEARRRDGVLTRFDKRKGYFGAYDPDGAVRTFFIPNDGIRYFYRQAGKAHD